MNNENIYPLSLSTDEILKHTENDSKATEKQEICPNNDGMIRNYIGNVIKKIKHDTYAVHFNGQPGMSLVQCNVQIIHQDSFDDLYNSDVFLWNEGQNPTVKVELGPFCLKRGMFFNCTLRCPPSMENDDDTHYRKRRRIWKCW